MNQRIIREQKHLCGKPRAEKYMEVDYFPVTEAEHRAPARAKAAKASSLIQKNLNAANARRHLVQLVNGNFTENDLYLTLTYDEEHLPFDAEQAEKDLKLFLRRVGYWAKKFLLDKPRYIAVTEYQTEDAEHKEVRFHHHIIWGCGIARGFLEDLWRDRAGDKMGLCNADRLQLTHASLEALANYLTKYPNRKHRWHQSRGLRMPRRPLPNDRKVKNQAQLDRMAKERVDDREFWETRFPGWRFERCEPKWNDTTAEWSLYCVFWRDERDMKWLKTQGVKKWDKALWGTYLEAEEEKKRAEHEARAAQKGK